MDRTVPGTGPGSEGPGPSGELVRGVLLGRYVLLGKLGAGGMGVVYAAYDPELDRKVALKLVAPHVKGHPHEERPRLLREAQALAKLAHPNVVTIHDVGTHEEQVWIAMEFVAGQTLGTWARSKPRRWPELLRVLVDAARGVAAAHAAGLVHRDLKPDNVMIGSGSWTSDSPTGARCRPAAARIRRPRPWRWRSRRRRIRARGRSSPHWRCG